MRSARLIMRKRLGQHLLVNPDVVSAIVSHGGIQPGDRVLEIGPGTGNLTAHLLASPASRVYAVELDARMHGALLPRVSSLGPELAGKLSCVRGDFLRVGLPPFDVLVANIPYQISSPVLHRLFAHCPLPRRAVIMFQKEFAERMVAPPGGAQYCRLSVNTALLSSAAIVQRIGAAQFRPPPKVDSAVVLLEPKGWPPGLDYADWDGLLRMCFEGKNKTLRALLGGNKTRLAGLTLSSSTGAEQQQQQQQELVQEVGGSSGEELVETSLGTVPRGALAATRERILSVLTALGADSWRANAMPLEAFTALYQALRQEGFRFTSPAKPQGEGREYPQPVSEAEWLAMAAAPVEASQHDLYTGAATATQRLGYLIPGSRRERQSTAEAGAAASRLVGWGGSGQG
jgi:18S rRNA (adenine1779-N6/adenine1780-N6)-dimethyltransferase